MSTLLTSHWYWRPGWAPGRRYYTWHLTVGPQIGAAVGRWQQALARFPDLDVVPAEWLHLTVQGVGFADEVADGRVEDVAAAVRAELARVRPLDLVFDPPRVVGEGVTLDAAPREALEALRAGVRRGVAAACGAAPGEDGGFWPHVSLAYASGPARADEVAAALGPGEPVRARVDAVALIRLERAGRLYRWERVAQARLGG